MTTINTPMGEPTAEGWFGSFGGRYAPESLMPACL